MNNFLTCLRIQITSGSTIMLYYVIPSSEEVTDAESNQSLNIRTTAVLSLLIQGPLNVDISDIEWMEITDQLELRRMSRFSS